MKRHGCCWRKRRLYSTLSSNLHRGGGLSINSGPGIMSTKFVGQDLEPSSLRVVLVSVGLTGSWTVVLPCFWRRSDSRYIRFPIIFPFISHHFPSRSFAFLCAVSRSHRAPIPYLHIIFVHLRDTFARFSYSFICLLAFTPSLPVTFLHIPSHFLAFLSLGLAQFG